MLPKIDSTVHRTSGGVSYLKAPGVALLGVKSCDLEGVQPFLEGFDPALQFGHYLADPDTLPSGTQLVKFAGQLCYLSLGPKRTWNREALKYLGHILESGHGSVLEHADFTFLAYGISRSLTHELVRHRLASYSQVSQRYVSGATLRFVERPEYQDDSWLHDRFEQRIEYLAHEYEELSAYLFNKQAQGDPSLHQEGDRKTDARKRVQQTSRSCLPNETEAPIVCTFNVRMIRHFFEMRAARPAEVEIRRLAHAVFRVVKDVEPMIFKDYEEEELPDGTVALRTNYRKV